MSPLQTMQGSAFAPIGAGSCAFQPHCLLRAVCAAPSRSVASGAATAGGIWRETVACEMVKPSIRSFAVNPRRTPPKILVRHADDELAKLVANSPPPAAPTTAAAIAPQP
jgi:hypothetical protein